jgi:hypothetical protein
MLMKDMAYGAVSSLKLERVQLCRGRTVQPRGIQRQFTDGRLFDDRAECCPSEDSGTDTLLGTK